MSPLLVIYVSLSLPDSCDKGNICALGEYVGDSRTAKMAGFFYSIDCSEEKNTDLWVIH